MLNLIQVCLGAPGSRTVPRPSAESLLSSRRAEGATTTPRFPTSSPQDGISVLLTSAGPLSSPHIPNSWPGQPGLAPKQHPPPLLPGPPPPAQHPMLWEPAESPKGAGHGRQFLGPCRSMSHVHHGERSAGHPEPQCPDCSLPAMPGSPELLEASAASMVRAESRARRQQGHWEGRAEQKRGGEQPAAGGRQQARAFQWRK